MPESKFLVSPQRAPIQSPEVEALFEEVDHGLAVTEDSIADEISVTELVSAAPVAQLVVLFDLIDEQLDPSGKQRAYVQTVTESSFRALENSGLVHALREFEVETKRQQAEGPRLIQRNLPPPEPASVVARGLAAAIDCAVALAVAVLIFWALIMPRDLWKWIVFGSRWDRFFVLTFAPQLCALWLVAWVVLVTVFTAGGEQTIGQGFLGLRTVSRQRQSLPFGQALNRSLLILLTPLFGGLPLLALLGKSRRGLHDLLVGSFVTRARRKAEPTTDLI